MNWLCDGLVIVFLINFFVKHISCASDEAAHIRENTFKNDGSGNYFFRFHTSNGITREEYGKLDSTNSISVEGQHSYKDKDNIRWTVFYKADKDGYRILKTDTQNIVRVDNRIPTAAIASLAGGGLG